jgi:hypothetical protein
LFFYRDATISWAVGKFAKAVITAIDISFFILWEFGDMSVGPEWAKKKPGELSRLFFDATLCR